MNGKIKKVFMKKSNFDFEIYERGYKGIRV